MLNHWIGLADEIEFFFEGSLYIFLLKILQI